MFEPATDVPYRRFLNRLHTSAAFDWYLEIGCRRGDSVERVRGKTIVVDPYFQISKNVIGAKPAFHAFQDTSDAFFDSGFLDKNDIRIGFAFLDGMHLFEYLLRDFINTEKRADPKGAIAMHDCCPANAAMTTRDLDNLPAGDWTGDVWKLIPILAEYRPDLTVDVYGCAPTGLVVAHGLDPENDALARAYDDIVANYATLDIESFGVERFFGGFDYIPARPVMRAGFPFLDGVRRDPEGLVEPERITP